MSIELPTAWRMLPLEECMAAIIDYRGKTPKKTSSGVPLITAKVVKGGRILPPEEFIDPSEYDDWMRRGLPKKGDILLTTEAPLGEVAQLGSGRFALAQRIICLRGKPELLDNDFLQYLLQAACVQEQLHARATGTTVLGIKQSELRRVLLPLPSLHEQVRIAWVLKALDEKVENNRQMNETLEAMARALFKSWFVDFNPIRTKKGDPRLSPLDGDAAELAHHFITAGNKEIPFGWSLRTIRQICDSITSGGTPSTSNADFWGGGIPWLASGETRASFVTGTEKTITPAAVNNSSVRFARAGATVIAGAGQGKTRGQTSLLLIDVYVNQSVVALTADRTCISDLYLFFDLSRRYEEFRSISDSHSSRGSLTTAMLGSLSIVVPPLSAVHQFDAVVSPMVEQIRLNLEEMATLAKLREQLLPGLLSGELRVRDAERTVEATV